MPTVVIVAAANDFHAQAVANQIRDLGGAAAVLDSEEFLSRWQISHRIGQGNIGFDVILPETTIRDDDLAGVWWRRPNPIQIAEGISDPDAAEFSRREARALLHGFLFSLGARVINPLAAHRAGRNKPYQLMMAQKSGFRVPRTLITNIPEDVEKFRADVGSDVIFKILTAAPEQLLIETRVLEKAHEPFLEAVKLAPLIFQERISKIADVRVTVIDDRCFSVECRTESNELDWRIAPVIRYLPYDLPEAISDKLVALHRALGLRFGAVDLCVTREGEYVFLETNVGGQFMFGEIEAGLPLAQAMARALLKPPASAV